MHAWEGELSTAVSVPRVHKPARTSQPITADDSRERSMMMSYTMVLEIYQVRCTQVASLAGYLRHVTSRYEPSINGSLHGPTSLFRPKNEQNGSQNGSTPGNGAGPNSQNGAK
jgi:hypothetical protein